LRRKNACFLESGLLAVNQGVDRAWKAVPTTVWHEALSEFPRRIMNLSSEASIAKLVKLVPEIPAADKCPDFIEERAHYFGDDLPNEDKLALIEFLKAM
jgi:hypothetical protein